MSMVLMVEAMKAKVGNPGRKLVLLKLADNANDKGECWPSYQHIADHTEMGRSTVKAHIKQLESDGYLVKVARNDGKSSNQYLLSIAAGETRHRHISTRSNPDPVSIKPGQDSDHTRSNPDPVTRSDSDPRTSHYSEPVNEPVTSATSDCQRRVDPVVNPAMVDRDGVELVDNWVPLADTIARLARLGVPEQFAISQIPEFTAFWLTSNRMPERGRNWNTTFLQRVKDVWQQRAADLAATKNKPSWEYVDHDFSAWFSIDSMAAEINPEHIAGWLRQCEQARLVVDSTRIALVADVLREAERATAVPVPMLVEEVYLMGWSRFKSDWLVNKFGLCPAERQRLRAVSAA